MVSVPKEYNLRRHFKTKYPKQAALDANEKSLKGKKRALKARNKAYEKLYKKLETKKFKIAKQRNRQSKDVQQVRIIKSKTGEILMKVEKVKQRWKEYFDNLLNHENPRERRETRTEGRERDVEEEKGVIIDRLTEEIRKDAP